MEGLFTNKYFWICFILVIILISIFAYYKGRSFNSVNSNVYNYTAS